VSTSPKYFDPEALARIRPLGLRARTLVEGLVSGLHRSPLRGHSIEFAQHREYVPGDDFRQIDWKIYARSDKYYLKQYEDETSLTCYLLVDHSESMLYGSSPSDRPAVGLSKLQYAQLIAFSLAYLVVEQRDYAALMTFSDKIDDWLPPSGSPVLFDDMIALMERAANHRKTNLPRVLEEAGPRLVRRGLVVVISDFLDDAQRLLSALRVLRFVGHDVLLIHVLDRDEVDFPFDSMSRFEGFEGWPEVVTDPRMIGQAYRKAMADFCRELETGCRQQDMDYFRVLTDESLAAALPRILANRSARGY
jgi:uncharacterized protein (DUF58 family)